MKKRYLLMLPVVALSMFTVTSCGDKTNTSDTTEVTSNLQSIRLDQTDMKTRYIIGEELSLDGLKVTATYIDGTQKEITDYSVDTSEFDNSKKGDYYIRITYSEGDVVKVRTVSVSVSSILDNENYLVGITASGMKTEYKYQEEIDFTGLVVTAQYKDGTKKVINSSEYTIESASYDSSKRGNYEIVILYNEVYSSGAFSETVEVKTCYFASVIMNMTKISVQGNGVFYQYDDISTADWKVTVSYSEGVEEVITTGFETNISTVFENTNTATSYKTVTVSYTYNGVTETASKSCRVLGTNYSLNTGILNVCDVQNTEQVIDSNFTLLPGYSVLFDSGECGTQLFTKCISFNNTGSRDENAIKITIPEAARIDVCVASDEGSTFGIYDSEGNPLDVRNAGSTIERFTFNVTSGGTYYIWAGTSITLYYIGIWN